MEGKQASLFDLNDQEAMPGAPEQDGGCPKGGPGSGSESKDKPEGLAQGRLFGEEPVQIGRKAATNLPATRNATAPARTPPEEEKLPDLQEGVARRIRYAGEWIVIRPEDAERLDTLDKIREFLRTKCDYPELTKDRTEMQHERVSIKVNDQDVEIDMIIPVVKAKKAGQQAVAECYLHPDHVPPGRRTYHLLARDGLFEVKRSRVGCLSTLIGLSDEYIPVQGHEVDYGALVNWKEGFVFCLPRIPGEMLLQVLAFFRTVGRRFGTEAMALIYWVPDHSEYLLEIPLQRVTPVSVDLDEDYLVRNARLQADCLEVCRLHSHNTMRSIFSATDDAWETANQVYGVFGRLNRPRLEASFRYRCGDRFIRIVPFDIFSADLDAGSPIYCRCPREWLERVVVERGK